MSIILILLIGGCLAWVGSHGSVEVYGWPLFAVCGAVSFLLNWIVFMPSYAGQTEHYFDLTGTITYISLILFAALLNPQGVAGGETISPSRYLGVRVPSKTHGLVPRDSNRGCRRVLRLPFGPSPP